jgi:tRNA(Ile)-lysidine synthase
MKDLIRLRRSRALKNIYELLDQNGFKKPLVAFSAGPDSCFLLASCACLIKRKSSNGVFNLHACHVNHNLRSSAIVDQEIAKSICQSFGVDLTVIDIYFKDKNNIYHNARQKRYDALYDCAIKNNCDCILTAHHGDDLLETVIMQICRGVSIEKIGMNRVGFWKDMPLLRPLYDFTKLEIENLLNDLGICFAIDPSNDSERVRSKIRKKILPIMKEINPNVHVSAQRIFVKK